jgi:uncharacterized protein with von Willebrand factor type A (vWA) domain
MKEEAMKQLDQAVESIRIAKRRARSGNMLGAVAELDIAKTILESAKDGLARQDSKTKS